MYVRMQERKERPDSYLKYAHVEKTMNPVVATKATRGLAPLSMRDTTPKSLMRIKVMPVGVFWTDDALGSKMHHASEIVATV